MPDLSGVALPLVLLLILGAEFVNGWTDAPNAVATVVGTRSLSPLQAVVMAAFLNFAGVLSGTAVATTIAKDIIDPQVVDLATVAGAMLAIIIWSSFAARLGLPTSETHALVAGLSGAGLATAGPGALLWAGWQKTLIGLVFSTFLGFGGGLVIMIVIYRAFRRISPGRAKSVFRRLQIGSSAFMAFGHGSNDGQKFMGAFTLALFLSGRVETLAIPYWVMVLCAVVMFLGTITGGWRIMHTMGMKMTRLETHQGFAAETGAATTIQVASALGIPVSTTHTISTAIMGVGAVRRVSAVRWGVTQEIVTAWILTFPICGLIAFGVVKLIRWFAP